MPPEKHNCFLFMEKKEFAQKFANAFAQLGLNVIDEETGKPLNESEVAQLAEDNLVYTEHPQEYYEELYRKKIKGWYSTPEYEDKAVKRMISQREEIITLLLSTHRPGIDNVIQYLDDRGFYYRASSTNGHHNFPGGLAEHCLGVCKLALKKAAKKDLPRDSVIIAAICHDICKADRFWFKGRFIRRHTPKCGMDSRHSARSIAILKDCGLELTEQERRAIRWHMKDPKKHPRLIVKFRDYSKAIEEELWDVVFSSDKKDAKAHSGSKHKNNLT